MPVKGRSERSWVERLKRPFQGRDQQISKVRVVAAAGVLLAIVGIGVLAKSLQAPPAPVQGAEYLPFDPMIPIPRRQEPFASDKRLPVTIGGEHVQIQSEEEPYNVNLLKKDKFDILRVECRPGEQRKKKSESRRGIDRCEVMVERNFEFGRRYRREFYFLVEPRKQPLTGENLKLVQDHNVNDPGDGSLGPTFALQLDGMNLKVVKRTDVAALTKGRVRDEWLYGAKPDSLAIQYGRVYHVEIEQVYDWDPNGKGMVKVLVDGQTIVDAKGPIGYNDKVGPYPKFGVYRPTDSDVPCTIRFFIPSKGFIEDLGLAT